MSDLQLWLALCHANLPRVELREACRLLCTPGARLPSLLTHKFHCPEIKQAVNRDLAWRDSADNHHIIMLNDEHYPALLREIAGAPLLLYVRGNLEALAAPGLAIVGSRRATPSGKALARQFASDFCAAGFAVHSGMAAGIDAAAHRGALVLPGITVAVFGAGIDQIYPRQNLSLAREILDTGGALVSEYPPGTPPAPFRFPERNRIISGLGLGVLVVEASIRSGSLITARLAGEQGRDVFALPGSVRSDLSRGCHVLLRQGACLVESLEDIARELGWQPRTTTLNCGNEQKAEVLSTEEKQLLSHLGYDVMPIDLLVQQSGRLPADVSRILVDLELKGMVTQVTGRGMQRIGGT